MPTINTIILVIIIYILKFKNMRIYLLLLLLIPFTIFSQDLEKIKMADTIYIYFKRDKNQYSLQNNSINLNNLNYYYTFEYAGKYRNYMTFVHHYSLSPKEKREKRSFLKKNKDYIITHDFLTKYDLAEATDLIGHKKRVYLIDYDDICWFSIKLVEVKVMGTWPQSIE